MKHLSAEDKVLIEAAKFSVSELSVMLGFSTRTIAEYATSRGVVLPRKTKSALRYHIALGQKYGLLTVRHVVMVDGKTRYACRCDCGAEVVRVPRSLFATRTPNCGCAMRTIHVARRKGDGEASAHSVFLNYQSNAYRRSLAFDLSEEAFRQLCQQPCFYCGTPPANSTRRGNSATPFIYNGVDRLDNSQGYVEGNCVPCCKRCNVAKADMTTDQFADWVSQIVANMARWRWKA